MPRIQIAAIFLLFIFSFVPVAESAFRPEVFEYKEGRISIKGNRLSVVDILSNISEIADIRIFVFDPVDNRLISVDLMNVSCHSALKSIIKGSNFAIVYFKDTRHFSSSSTTSGFDETDPDESTQSNSSHGYALTGDLDPLSSGVSPEQGIAEHYAYKSPAKNRLTAGKYEGVFLLAGKKGRIRNSRQSSRSPYGNSSHEPASGESMFEYENATPEHASGSDPYNPSPPSGSSTEFPSDFSSPNDPLDYIIENLKQRIASGESDRSYEYWSDRIGPRFVVHDRVLLEHYVSKKQNQ